MTLNQALEKTSDYNAVFISRQCWADKQIMAVFEWGYTFYKYNLNEAWYNRWGITSYALTIEDLKADDWQLSNVLYSDVFVDL